jgi:putative flippase GtrA
VKAIAIMAHRLYANPQFAAFVVVSGGAAAMNVLSRLLFSLFLVYWAAVALAYAVGMAVAFVLNKVVVFPNSDRPLSHNLIYFVMVNAIAFPQVLVVSLVLGKLFLPPVIGVTAGEALGHAVGVAAPAFSSFALHKFVTFRESAPAAAPAAGEPHG